MRRPYLFPLLLFFSLELLHCNTLHCIALLYSQIMHSHGHTHNTTQRTLLLNFVITSSSSLLSVSSYGRLTALFYRLSVLLNVRLPSSWSTLVQSTLVQSSIVKSHRTAKTCLLSDIACHMFLSKLRSRSVILSHIFFKLHKLINQCVILYDARIK